jgi:DNA-binding NtrC family response regulator
MSSGQANENTVVLMMDRDDEDVQLITSLLEKTGFQVVLLPEKADLLKSCRALHHGVQLVIIDTEIRGLQLSELLDEVRTVDPKIRVLLMSKNKPESVQCWSVTGNVRGLLNRPFRRAQFLGSVLEVAKQPLVRSA